MRHSRRACAAGLSGLRLNLRTGEDMPYQWTDGEAGDIRLELWPYRSLPKRGFVLFIGATVAFLALPLFAVIGSVILWALLPFLAIAVGAIWWALAHSYRTGEVLEVLTLTPEEVRLSQFHANPAKGAHWQANTHWARPELIAQGGPVPDYLVLHGGPRVVELGAFLTPSERRALFTELCDNLLIARTAQADQPPDSGIQ